MKRRNFLGLVAGAASGSLVVGSGAFNTSRVDREISVDIETDERAYLGLNALRTNNEEGDKLGRSGNPGNQTVFRFPGTYEELDDLTRGDGLGTNSEYYFDRLVEVRNQGTDPVIVYSEFSGELGDIALYESDNDERSLLTNKDRGIALEPGEDFDAGVFIDSADVDPGTTVEETLTIVGNAAETA